MPKHVDERPFPVPDRIDPFVAKLDKLVGGRHVLDMAVRQAYDQEIVQMQEWGITDGMQFLLYATGMLKWIPKESFQGRDIYYALCLFYFVLDMPAVVQYQTPINPENVDEPLSPVSQWMVTYAQKIGDWMDREESLTPETLQSFIDSPPFNVQEAQAPPGGYKTFNQLFARHLKEGMRPISEPDNDRLVTFPADSAFDGAWAVDDNSMVNIKGLEWPISGLLQNSKYAADFAGGNWMHAFLNTTDYHRQHAPVCGTVIEAKVIQSQAYLQVDVQPDEKGRKHLVPHRSWKKKKSHERPHDTFDALDAPNEAGYQFLQTRGCVIIDNKTLGKVAVLPIGMAMVSSVKLSVKDIWDEGAKSLPTTVEKGDEISCFQFGGSDIVLVFQKGAQMDLSTLELKKHYKVGEPLARSKLP